MFDATFFDSPEFKAFEDRLVERISSRVIESLGEKITELAKDDECTLTGLRRAQFDRFRVLMKEDPTRLPFRAAKQALAELPGRGGYPKPSSLQRYAINHRSLW